MKHLSIRSTLPILAGLALAFPARPAAAQEAALAAETYGRAGGDAPHADLGLVLELVDAGTPSARLRLFGGLPGHPAGIAISAARHDGAPALVGSSLLTASGAFDWHGAFELSLAGLELEPGETLYAQGVHTGVLDLGGAPLRQYSHGLELRGVEADEAPLAFDDFLPHLPDSPELAGSSGLAEQLQRMLNSPGDSVRIAVEIEATVGLGIEVVDAKAGGKLGCEFTVERGDDGLYEVVIAAEIAGLAGVGAGTGAELGAEGSGGYGAARLFRFHSAPGAARGILGMVLALRFPALQPGRFVAGSGFLGDAAEHMAELRAAVGFAQEHADELEQLLRDALDAAVARAEAARRDAAAGLAAATRDYATSPWYLRGVHAARMAAWRGVLAGADARLAVARGVRDQSARALDLAKAFVEARRAELLAVVREVARAGRIAASIAQLRGWATDHYAGTEVRHATAAEVEAKLKAPIVDMKNFGAGTSVELEREFVTRWEPARGEQPARVTVVQALQLERKAWGGVLVGGELACKRSIEVADEYRLEGGASVPAGRSVTFTKDMQVVGAIGLVVAEETGVGRTRTISLGAERASDLASLVSFEDLVARAGAAEVGFELQDRRQKNLDVAFAVDVSGNGGGIEIELEWADAGRLLSRTTALGEAVASVLDGASEVIDVETGTVRVVE